MSDYSKKGLKLSHLRLAAALGRHGQLSVAADHLRVSQPAASRLASEIEAITGAPPYHRSGRGIELTPEGLALAERAERILGEIEAAGRDIAELSSGTAGHVRIGSVTGPALEFVLPLIHEFRAASPDIRFHVEVATSDKLCDLIADGRLDLALARLPDDDSARAFGYHHLGAEPLSLVVRAGHPALAARGPVPVHDLLQYDWILPELGMVLRSAVDRALRQEGYELPPRTLTTSSTLLLLATIQKTDAIAPMAKAVVAPFSEIAAIRAFETDIAFSAGGYGLITGHTARLSPVASRVHQSLLELAQGQLQRDPDFCAGKVY